MTVTADEDCIATVIAAPSSRLKSGFEVILRRTDSSRPPVSFSSSEDMTFIPNRKKEIPQINLSSEKMSINYLPDKIF